MKQEDKHNGFLMISYKMPDIIKKLHSIIPLEELYKEEGSDDYGLEKECHVTLVPCLDDDLNVGELKKYLRELSAYGLLLTNISKFDNEKFDVLKCDVNSDILKKSNEEICAKFPTFSEYTEFHPHMTVAYLKKGMADKYLQDIITPLCVLEPLKFMFSHHLPDGTRNKVEWIEN